MSLFLEVSYLLPPPHCLFLLLAVHLLYQPWQGNKPMASSSFIFSFSHWFPCLSWWEMLTAHRLSVAVSVADRETFSVSFFGEFMSLAYRSGRAQDYIFTARHREKNTSLDEACFLISFSSYGQASSCFSLLLDCSSRLKQAVIGLRFLIAPLGKIHRSWANYELVTAIEEQSHGLG